MPTDPTPLASSALFLFAHQDDEFGVYQAIVDELQAGHRVFCAYMTNGASAKVTALRRNSESLSVLEHIGVHTAQVFFPGTELCIPDGALPRHLSTATQWLLPWLQDKSLRRIYVPAWEGGHQDHDALHALTVLLARAMNSTQSVRQFSLYNCVGVPHPLFHVLRPMSENGPSLKRRIPVLDRFRFLRYCLSYSSQWGSWLGLFPMVAIHYLFRGCQETQTVDADRIEGRPHTGALYYERRGFFTWGEMQQSISNWERPSCA